MTKKILLLFTIISVQVFGQSQNLKGRIVADSLQGYAINIVNYTKKIGATNDRQGSFEIPATVGDSIIFSSVQYEILSLIVNENYLNNDTLKIVLRSVVQKLEEVKVSNVELSGNLDKDSKNIETQPYVDNKILGLPFSDKPQPTLAERRLYTAKSGIIDGPINYLNGTVKKLKRIKKIEDFKNVVNQGEIILTTSFFVDSLGVPKDLISDFIYYCAEDESYNDLLDDQKRLELFEFFQEKSKSYRIHKEID
ncbi:hypothetical protein U6A24_14840 [Aquimarina gracilis]|uniref:Carboxypeptidase-like protein n=1 Tax=Aquimarina gracilis TaxID=874422 RepID=A0ABU5ZXZ3_9FLAO|nr:hypothetical protein [Aquimarina gracilis]MEB3346752.1 hypothetical protein [Aquimarina gracilis]